MPRVAREKSESGVYHVMVRGINRQDIFHDEEDRGVYLDRLSRYKKECGFELYAFCLMNNHIHILLKEGKEELSKIMKKIGSSYVYWYNWKYERTGHLFQDRYKSEAVEDDEYLLTVTRYIHQNPVKVGLDINFWTSYEDYLGESKLIDTSLIMGLFHQNSKDFQTFMNEMVEDICLDVLEQDRIKDEDARRIIMDLTGVKDCQELQRMSRERRNEGISMIKKEGLSIRQIERITGINRGTILNV